MQADFERITQLRAARLDLSERGLLSVRGSDRERFLESMLTSRVQGLPAGASSPAALLDRKGHLIADLNALALPDEILLDVAPGRATAVREALAKLIVADDVTLEPLDGWSQVGFEGPGAVEQLSRAGAPAPEPGRWVSEDRDGTAVFWLGGGGLGDQGLRLLGPRDTVESIAAGSGLPVLSQEQAEILRVEAFLPLYGVDMGERSFPQEARLDRALSRDKGCYIGQEIVARIDSRGAVNRLLVQLWAEAPVQAGDPIRGADPENRGREIGSVTSAVVSPASGPLALGYVRRSSAAPGTRVQIGSSPGRVVGPPLGE